MYTDIEISCKEFTYVWFLSNCEQITTLLAKPNSIQQSNTASFRTYSFWEETILPVATLSPLLAFASTAWQYWKPWGDRYTFPIIPMVFFFNFPNFVLRKVLFCDHIHNRMNSYSNDFIKLMFQNKDNSKVYYLLLCITGMRGRTYEKQEEDVGLLDEASRI